MLVLYLKWHFIHTMHFTVLSMQYCVACICTCRIFMRIHWWWLKRISWKSYGNFCSFSLKILKLGWRKKLENFGWKSLKIEGSFPWKTGEVLPEKLGKFCLKIWWLKNRKVREIFPENLSVCVLKFGGQMMSSRKSPNGTWESVMRCKGRFCIEIFAVI